ncbi:type II secretion system F family protein [Prauserella marina]|nr:pilus assembly protein TadB [Prauserella marina]
MWSSLLGVVAALAITCLVLAFVPPSTAEPGREPGRVRRTLATLLPVRRGLVACALGVLAWWATGWPVAAILVVLAGMTVPTFARGKEAQQLIARLDALASWVRRLGDVLASGAGGLEQAIVVSARNAPEALATEIDTLAVRVRTRGLEPALRAFADDVADVAADEVVLALIMRSRAGGRGLAAILDSKATALERDVVARRDIEADRAKPRTDVRTILAITAVMLLGLMFFAGEFLTPYNGLLGQLVLAGIGGVLCAAGWWMHILIRTRRPARLLGASARTPVGTAKPQHPHHEVLR